MEDEIKLIKIGEANGIHFSIPIVTNNWRKMHHRGLKRRRNYWKALEMDFRNMMSRGYEVEFPFYIKRRWCQVTRVYLGKGGKE